MIKILLLVLAILVLFLVLGFGFYWILSGVEEMSKKGRI